ncbi:hypothetical protein [Psychrobacter alimentarius]|uniref:hypothetical protein n=1 Tax=Psychrobacter alimentarius TaxID=261164 RepID=UPI003FD00B11
MNLEQLPGLQVKSTLGQQNAPNFKPNCWPPKKDFPVTLDLEGNPLSLYGDVRWNLTVWNGHTASIYFGDGPGRGKAVSPENAAILRQITAWWLWGPDAVSSAKSLMRRFQLIRAIFYICTEHGILATELYNFPIVMDDVITKYAARKETLIPCLVKLLLAREHLGFVLIDEKGISLLDASINSSEKTQTAYIPPRIWSYQILRLQECLQDFLKHKQEITSCYNFCLELYAHNAGGNLSDAFPIRRNHRPFHKAMVSVKNRSGRIYYESFSVIAKRYGIHDLIEKWVNEKVNMRSFSRYFSLMNVVGLAYVLNFSLMRIQEGSRLRANCYETEKDDFGNEVHILRGVTTKTIKDDNARWIVPPTVKVAIEVMELVAQLRLKSAKENPHLSLSKEDINNPVLQSFLHEPWSDNSPRSQPNGRYKKMFSYSEAIAMWPKLFETSELQITKNDLEIANRLTPGLNTEKFAIGKVWPLAWHQLRRTGAVNMLASGLVTDTSLQYQLKHASRAMSQYYGKNYYRLKEPLNEHARNTYLSEMYKLIVREFEELQSDDHISPHGEKRKNQILHKITEKDHKQLLNAAKNGDIKYRQTLLGGCVKSGPSCPYGGINNISSCMGHDNKLPCESILLDTRKLSRIKRFNEIVSIQIENVEQGSLLHESLNAQLESSERAINVIENI